MQTDAKTAVLTSLYAKTLLIRRVEQRLLKLFAEGKLFGTVHTCIGQEWTGVAVCEALRDGDQIFSNHRCHGHFLARTGDVEGLIAEIMGKQTGICGGRGGSQHICSQGVFSNGVQGGIAPVSAGLAFAHKLRRSGNIALCFIGDGTLGEGALYETMNIASKWELPLLIVLENNLYAQSTPQSQTLAGDIGARAAAFGIRVFESDTGRPEALLSVAADAVEYVRDTSCPAFLRIDTYRLMAHSKGDDDRDPAEVQSYWKRDPITRFEEEFPEDAARMNEDASALIEVAVAKAEAAPYTAPSVIKSPYRECVWSPTRIEGRERMVNVIHAALQRNMARDERIILLGEDIEGPYGGAFKVTKNLSAEFPGRVRNTPISEAAIVGLGNGLALSGMRPVCELMFGDFMALAADQLINHASKFRYMYNGQVDLPLIVRTPMGGKRGYGATHSQSIEKHFLGLPDSFMLALHNRYDPGLIYDELLTSLDRLAIVIENKLLYGAMVSSETPEGFTLEHTDERFPTTRLRPEAAPDFTLLVYGGMLPDAEKAAEILFDEHEIVAEVICPVQLHPLNIWPVLDSVRASGRLLIAEEGQNIAAFGSEVVACLHECAPGVLKQVKRVGPPPHPIPSCGPLEKALLPGAGHILQATQELLRHG